jgi:sigma-B regulation protein RsbU (phosphoserine phosphatase)
MAPSAVSARGHSYYEAAQSAYDRAMASPVEDGIDAQLAHLQLLTDSALIRLDVDDLLDELLNRVREIFAADTAAVLLLDEASQELVARAARGIEEEVREGVRVPIGTGFAGRIAATNGAVRLDRVDATTVANPILWEKGIQVMLGVPLMSGDKVLGVLHVGRLEARPFTQEDTELLEVVAERVAGAIQHRQVAIEQAAARWLERSLLPSSLPRCAGLELAARYAPADNRIAGGDWYDVFTLPSGDLWIVLGDVAGHGLAAAVVMGRIRSALRAYAMLGVAAEEVLELLDRKVRHFEIGMFATVVCAVSRPPHESFRIAVAGHPPPILAEPDFDSHLVEVHVTPPIGVGDDIERTSITLPLVMGGVLAFYTDGLIERRGETLDVGLERLRRAVRPQSADTVVRGVMHSLVADSVPTDDIALVVARRI